jgi:hypothetical protein
LLHACLQVFDLGADGKEPAKRVAELTDFLMEVSRLPAGRSVFAPGEDKRGTVIKHLAVIRECCCVQFGFLRCDGAVTTTGAWSVFNSAGLLH